MGQIEEIVVGYDAEGEVRLGKQVVAIGDLASRLRAALAARAKKIVFLDVHPDANYGGAVKVMDICRGAGAETLGIMTPEKDEPPPSEPPTQSPH